mmetsp:Transcript_20536/g.48895  ORF Transcript_20536/g.48895 Transcript_20536/m.48895 type:complete len:247 (+) Transcript_20536:180-920(+)
MPDLRTRRTARKTLKTDCLGSVGNEEPDGSDVETDSGFELAVCPPKRARAEAPTAASKRRKVPPAPVDLQDLDLFGVVAHHGGAVKTAAKEWAERYLGGRLEATAELMTLLVKACGCPYVVTAADVDEGAIDDLVQRISDAIREEGTADAFSGRGGKTFRSSLEDLLDRAVQEAHAREFLFDDFFCEKLANFLTALSWSARHPICHPLRHSCPQNHPSPSLWGPLPPKRGRGGASCEGAPSPRSLR